MNNSACVQADFFQSLVIREISGSNAAAT